MKSEIKMNGELKYQNCENGYYKITTPNGTLITNETGIHVIKSIKNGFSFESIIEKYNMEGPDKVNEIITFLEELESNELIFLNREVQHEPKKQFNIAGEKEYSKISYTIIENYDSANRLFSSYEDKRYYNKYLIRSRGFYNYENYFFETADDKITNIVGVQNLHNYNLPVNICLLQYGNSVEDLIKYYKTIEAWLVKKGRFKIKLVVMKNKMNNQLELFLNASHFKLEGCLEKEDGTNDFMIFSKILEVNYEYIR